MNAVNGFAGPAGVEALPVITVTRGRATDAELAAVTAVLFAVRSAAALAADAAAAAAIARRPGSSPWAESARPRPDTLPRPSRRAWRASALPR
ncbi:acyl-CoA carboxylase subunit epsilon [Trebonia kvetii]|uniref:Acyl-CoA carboxylase subunit epsilon n=1 Tax=Trebonia kvetii TaxID=2480626 RepID=A0A6P2C521_9ACTN|nr:acyl-CoA carboxylase epsilon subunit [Trebonia kvetii]TVZ05595.1 acyl-CoA carboxylase subunit epsilon [Trebonia kvetii]